MTNSSNHPDSEPDYESLIAGIRRMLLDRLLYLMAEMVDATNDRLFELTGSTQDKDQRNHFYDLMRKFRDYKSLVYEDFSTNIKKQLNARTKMEPAGDDQEELELSLVDHEAMEDIVLVKSIGERSAGIYYETLAELEQRLNYLRSISSDYITVESISPVSYCQAFNDALGKGFSLTDKKPLFQIFSDMVTMQLGDTYKDINKLLINANIMPDLKHKAPKHPKTAPRTTPQVQDNQALEPESPSYAMTATPGQNFNYNQPASPGHALADQPNAPSIPPGMAQTISNYLGAPLTPEAGTNQTNNAFYPAPTPQAYGHEEILNALSNIQDKPEFKFTDVSQHNPESIKQALLSQIASVSGGVVTKQINQIAEKTISFIELIFDAIIEDDNISDTIKTLLLRLQIPVIKAAMIDPEFFLAETHPARILLDRIAEVGVGITEHDDEIYIELDKIITELVNEYELNTELFQKALDQLNAVIDERNAEASRKEEEAQKKVLQDHARKTVLAALRTITAGKTLPEPIHPLVLKRWPTLMYKHYLTNGRENDEWIILLQLLKQIVDSVQPVTGEEKLAELIAIRHELAENAYSHLIKSDQTKDDVHNAIKGLEEVHNNIIENSELSSSELEETAEKASEISYTPPDPLDYVPEEKPDLPKLPSSIMPGMWFKIYMGEDRPSRRCKLSVIIAAEAKLVFVNYQGEVLIEKEFQEFTDEISQDKSRVIMGNSRFDHALSKAVSHISH